MTEKYVTKSGKVLTDADIEAFADEAERGYDVSHLVGKPSRRKTVSCPDCAGSGIHGGPGGYYDVPGRGKPCGTCHGRKTVPALTTNRGPEEPNAEYVLPDGWTWAGDKWHPCTDPIWKSYRMARHDNGRLANFESRQPAPIDGSGADDD